MQSRDYTEESMRHRLGWKESRAFRDSARAKSIISLTGRVPKNPKRKYWKPKTE